MRTIVLEVDRSLDDDITAIASRNGISRSELFGRALQIMVFADEQKRKGNSLAFVRESSGSQPVVKARLTDVL